MFALALKLEDRLLSKKIEIMKNKVEEK